MSFLPRIPNAARKIVIIGAGPKAMAIAAKSTVLKKLGFAVPELHIIEKLQVGAHWSGRAGYTNGKMILGTSPEKDVGFPYDTKSGRSALDAEINREILEFSWTSYLIASGEYSNWIDRGKPAPCHKSWADYLTYVSGKLGQHVHMHQGEVKNVELIEDGWEVHFENSDPSGSGILQAHGLVVTGPGQSRTPFKVPQSLISQRKVLDLESFWKNPVLPSGSRVAVVGAGENAASVILALKERGQAHLQIDVISPLGAIFTRGENYFENRVYSNSEAGQWTLLSTKDRKEFVRRTDLGVFSVHAMQLLNSMHDLKIVAGRVVDISLSNQGQAQLKLQYEFTQTRAEYDHVILATGFDQAAFVKSLLSPETQLKILKQTQLPRLDADTLASRIGEDLSVEGLSAKLHLPMLSGLRQGPGFANLSCLGRLSDHILKPYLSIGVNREENEYGKFHSDLRSFA